MHTTYIYIYPVIIQNKGYAPGIALGRRIVSYVSRRWLQGFLLYEDLLLVFLDHLLVLLLSSGHVTPPTRSLNACHDDAILNIYATTTLKIRIHILNY